MKTLVNILSIIFLILGGVLWILMADVSELGALLGALIFTFDALYFIDRTPLGKKLQKWVNDYFNGNNMTLS